jgi:hypothetical protein
MARSPSWRTTLRPKTVNLATCGCSGPVLARRRFIMAGPSASRNCTMIRIRKRLLRKSATPERTAPMAPVRARGLSALCRSAFVTPRLLVRFWTLPS